MQLRSGFAGLSLASVSRAAVSFSTGAPVGRGISAIKGVVSPTFVVPATLYPKSTKVSQKMKLIQGLSDPILATDHREHGVSSPVQS
jgi:hypothetical protein